LCLSIVLRTKPDIIAIYAKWLPTKVGMSQILGGLWETFSMAKISYPNKTVNYGFRTVTTFKNTVFIGK
ncbi:MAG: hypothetical protein ACP5O1_12460, partial [Phycisphaerae bacterium]